MDLADIDDFGLPQRSPPGPSDAELRKQLERLLTLRRAAATRRTVEMTEAEETAARAERAEAAETAARLAIGAAGWAIVPDDVPGRILARLPPDRFKGLDPDLQRLSLAQGLEGPLAMLAPDRASILRHALQLLDQGEAVPLLSPGKARGKGRNAVAKTFAKRDIFIWGRWQHGRGEKWLDVLKEIEDAVCQGHEAVLGWWNDLRGNRSRLKVDTTDAASEFDVAEKIGRLQREGLSDLELRSKYPDIFDILEKQTLPDLAETLKVASAPRGRKAKR